MNKVFAVLLSVLLCVGLVLPAFAAEGETLTISTVDEFLDFAENCRLDSYSQGLTVILARDLDLSEVAFGGIPMFGGTFQGQGHTISGLFVGEVGSVQGLFRYLTKSALVQDLTVLGEVSPGGSRATVGGIAGSNEGKIINCRFSGLVSGGDYVGGLVGINTVTGIIENCRTEGTVQGSHFVGGLAGENYGVIRSCTNGVEVNNTAKQNSVGISDITLDTLTNSESAVTVTDVGGIAGTNMGVIRDCGNYADVGYRQIGYNIGGIAGSNTGYITGCENYGAVSGRKEVGGIVGQMEPVTQLEYSADSLQILQGQLNTMSALAGQATANAQSGSSKVNSQVSTLRKQTETARDALDQLLPDLRDPELPDPDSILAAQSALSSSVSSMPGTVNGIVSTSKDTVVTLTQDVQAIVKQVNVMGQTISNASELLGGSFEDVSDQDNETDFIGKVADCINYGAVLADLNAGGIAGSMAFENELDHEDDLQVSGDGSLNFESKVRVVVVGCHNRGTVTVKKQNGGGIVGWQPMGLIRNCMNSGSLNGQSADYIGGVAGRSGGYIRGASANCELSGDTYVGGIAGSGAIATDCRAMVRLSGTEKVGAILGGLGQSYTEVEDPLRGNLYLGLDPDVGGIDGISYSGQAEPLRLAEFLALEGLPELFQTVTVCFVFEDGSQQTIEVTPGSGLNKLDIPALPEKAGYVGEWAGLAEADLSDILFDMEFEAAYTRHSAVIRGEVVTGNELKVLLVQGSFTEGAEVSLTAANELPDIGENETLLEAWEVSVSKWESVTGGRYLLPEDADADRLLLMVQGEDGRWRRAEFTVDGSYAVFELSGSDSGIALVQAAPSLWSWQLIAAGGAVILLLLIVIVRKRKKRSTGPSEPEEPLELTV